MICNAYFTNQLLFFTGMILCLHNHFCEELNIYIILFFSYNCQDKFIYTFLPFCGMSHQSE